MLDHTEIRLKGKNTICAVCPYRGQNRDHYRKWPKLAAARDEELIEGETVLDPQSFVSQIKDSGLNADIFTFGQRLTDTAPKYNYHQEWDNFAVIPITSFTEWWEKRVESSVRRAVRKAAKLGPVVKQVDFDDEFVRGIVDINNEISDSTREGILALSEEF